MKRWDYDRPGNLWESLPWFIRWPLAVFAVCYFGSGLLIGVLLMLGVKP